MSFMTPQILKIFNFTKIWKSRYLKNETFFLQIKKFITHQELFCGKNMLVAEVTFKFTLNFLYDRYDLNQRMTFLENPKNSILLIRISWLIVSNAFWRSMSIIPVWRPDSKPVAILLFRYERHESVEKCFLNPDWNL